MIDRSRGQFTSSTDSSSKSPGICEIGYTRSRTSKNVQRSAKKPGMGHSKNSHGEMYNTVFSLSPPSNRHIGNSIHLEDPRSSHSNTVNTISPHKSNINITSAEASTHSQVATARRGEGVSTPRGGAHSNKVVKKK